MEMGKECHFLVSERSSLVKLLLPYQKCLSFPIKLQFSCNYSIQTSFVAAVIPIILSFNFSLHVHACHASFDESIFTECCLHCYKSIE